MCKSFAAFIGSSISRTLVTGLCLLKSVLSYAEDKTSRSIVDDVIDVLAVHYCDSKTERIASRDIDEISRMLRQDEALPRSVRCELAALSDHPRNGYGSGVEEVSKWAEVELNLIMEFPGEETPYVGLLGAAEANGSDEQSFMLASTIVGLSKAPDWVRDRAESVIARAELVGLSYNILADGLLPENLLLEEGQSVIVYTWSTQTAEYSRNLAKRLRQLSKASPDVVIIGLCIDAQLGEVVEAPRKLPGTQLNIRRAGVMQFAKRIHANLPHLLYESDDAGVLREVRVAR